MFSYTKSENKITISVLKVCLDSKCETINFKISLDLQKIGYCLNIEHNLVVESLGLSNNDTDCERP